MLVITTQVSGALSGYRDTHDRARRSPTLVNLGTVEINYDNDEAWVDCDPEQIYDDPGMREDNPEGFMWTCCDRALDTVGCKLGFHQQRGVKTPAAAPADEKRGNKRARQA